MAFEFDLEDMKRREAEKESQRRREELAAEHQRKIEAQEEAALESFRRQNEKRYEIELQRYDAALRALERHLKEVDKLTEEGLREFRLLEEQKTAIQKKRAAVEWESQHRFVGAMKESFKEIGLSLGRIPVLGQAIVGVFTRVGGAASRAGAIVGLIGTTIAATVIPALVTAHDRLARMRGLFAEIQGLTGGIAINTSTMVSAFAEFAMMRSQIPREETYRLAGGMMRGMFFGPGQGDQVYNILRELTYMGRAAPEFGPQGLLDVYVKMYTRLGLRGEELGKTFADLRGKALGWAAAGELNEMTSKMFVDTTLELQDQLKWWGITVDSSALIVKGFSKALMEGKVSVSELAAAFSPEQVQRGVRLLIYAQYGRELGLPGGMRPLDVIAGMGLIGVKGAAEFFRERGSPFPTISAEDYYRMRHRIILERATELGGGAGAEFEAATQLGYGVLTAQTEVGRYAQWQIMTELMREGKLDVDKMNEEFAKIAKAEWTPEGLLRQGLDIAEASNRILEDVQNILNRLAEWIMADFGIGWHRFLERVLLRKGILEEYIKREPAARRLIMRYPGAHADVVKYITGTEWTEHEEDLAGIWRKFQKELEAAEAAEAAAPPGRKDLARREVTRMKDILRGVEQQLEAAEVGRAMVESPVTGRKPIGAIGRFFAPFIAEPMWRALHGMKIKDLTKREMLNVNIEPGGIVIENSENREEMVRKAVDEVMKRAKEEEAKKKRLEEGIGR